MEKLIELLKEYDNEEFGEALYMENKVYANDFLIISKKYGFIKWLVENEKIDTTNLQDYWDRWEMGIGVFANMYKSDLIILTLSIQDNPIEFLISILK